MLHQINVEASTHDHMKAGITALFLHRIVVEDDNDLRAMETAHLMVTARGFYVTRVDLVL
jgi:hypothetical protein